MAKASNKKSTVKKSKITPIHIEEDEEEEQDVVTVTGESDIDDNDESSEEEPEAFISRVKMRKKRGNKMAKMIRKTKFEEDNDFKAWGGNKYFKDLGVSDLDDEGSEDFDEKELENIEEKSDSFDEDFGKSGSEDKEKEDDDTVSNFSSKRKYKKKKKSKSVKNIFFVNFLRSSMIWRTRLSSCNQRQSMSK